MHLQRSTIVAATTLLPMAATMTACAADDGSRGWDAVQVRDSAGVEIIENFAPLWTDAEAWSIDPEPILQIGETEGEAPYLFRSLREATRLPNGGIAIVDQGSFEVRIFGPDGTYRTTLGMRGQGPGEFGSDPVVAVAVPDTLLAWDQSHRRLTWFHVDGGLMRDTSLVSISQELDIPLTATFGWKLRSDGSILSTTGNLEYPGPGPGEVVFRPILIRALGEVAVRFGDFSSTRQLTVSRPDGMRVGIMNPFSPTVPMDLGADPTPVAIAGGALWEVTHYGMEGQARRLVRLNVPRVPVTPDILRRERESIADLTGVPGSQVSDALALLGVPDSIPAIAEMGSSPDGYLWVGRRSEPGSTVNVYDVIDPNGRWLGPIQLPPDFGRILEWGTDHVLTAWTNEVGVPFLRMHQIRK